MSITHGVLLAGIADYKAEAVFGEFPPRVVREMQVEYRRMVELMSQDGEFQPTVRTSCFVFEAPFYPESTGVVPVPVGWLSTLFKRC